MNLDILKEFKGKELHVVRSVMDIASNIGMRPYIVGGIVRDMLLGVKNHDLDFVIEGDAIRFAEKLAGKLKAPFKPHPAFRTASIGLESLRIDFATARKESYEHVASYPKVQPATIKEDLYRRDFTINAIAVSLNKDDFGRIIDFYNGKQDLKKGLIRVMHDKSFKDDPTRIFRAVRFAARFGFKIERHTRELMKEAVLEGCIGEVNPGRIKKEIELFLKEKYPLKCLKGLSGLI